MLCPNCNATYMETDTYCRHCGADVTAPSTSLIPLQKNLPTILQNAQLPRNVAASVGALALGVGIELVRRSLLARLSQPSRPVENALPALNSLKDILMPKNEKPLKRMPKGYEVEETVVYMRRVVRRQN